MSVEAILSAARQYFAVDPRTPITTVPIKQGASGRTSARVKTSIMTFSSGFNGRMKERTTGRAVSEAGEIPIAHILSILPFEIVIKSRDWLLNINLINISFCRNLKNVI